MYLDPYFLPNRLLLIGNVILKKGKIRIFNQKFEQLPGPRVEYEAAGFFFNILFFTYTRMMGYFRYSRIKECPLLLELPAGARNTRKAPVKIRRNPQLRILPLIQKFS